MAEKKYLDSGGLTTLVSNIKSKVETITNQLDNKKATKDELASAESRITAAEKDIDAAEVLLQSISSKLGGISSGAEVNQNAFSNVKVGSTTVAADAKQDTLELVAGTNVTISADAATDKISISAKDTTYGEATTSAAGLMSATDKTNLNSAVSKLSGIATGAEVNQNAFSNVKVGSTTVAADAKQDTLELAAGTNITIDADTATDKISISTTAEVNQNAFSNVKVGSTTVVADTKQDTLELVAGSNVTISADATNDKISISAKDTTYGEATTSAAGLMSATDKTNLNSAVNKLSGISSGAEVNQNAFSNVKVEMGDDSTTIAADTKTDTLTLVVGDNITIETDAANDKISISAKDTTYSVATTSAAGLMSATDKTNLNSAVSKLSGISSGAEVNQNAFSNVKVGSTTVAADTKQDTLELVAGTNITIDADVANDKISISTTAEVNQNAFSNVKVGSTTVAADAKQDTLELVAGSNVTISADAATDKISISAKDTTYGEATTSAAGLMSATDKTNLNSAVSKLSGIAAGAEVNQNSFSNVKVGSTTVAADTKQDTLELVAGSNVTISADAATDKISISAKDTTYGEATTSVAGLMSATDKTNLNSAVSKLSGIAAGAEVNQNSFSNVKVGSTTVVADAKQDTLELVAGSNITISADTATDKISISAKDTTYNEATTSAAGLMSASDKVKVNVIDAISSEVEINPRVVGGQVLAYVGNGYYVSNVSTGSTVSTTATINNGYEACILSVTVGEKYVIQAVGGSNPRVWCFTDSSYKVIHKCEVANLNCSGTSISNNPAIVIVPQNATRLLLNNTKSSNYEFKITKLIDGLDNGTARNPFIAYITGTASNAIAVTDPRFELNVGAELNIISDTNTSVKTLNVNGTGDVPFYYPSSTNTYQTFTVVKARPYKIFYNGYGWVISSPYVTYGNTSFCNIYPETATTRKSVSAYSSYPACNTIWLYNSSGWNDGSNGRIIIKFNIDVIDNDYICLYHYTNTSSTTAVGPTTAQYVRPLYFRGSPIKAGVIKAGDIVTLSKMSNDKNNEAKQYYDVLSIDRCNDNAWGTTSNNTSSLKISGESKTVSLSGHKHTKAEITDFPTIPTALKNPKALKFGSKTYDGSAEAEITAADLGLSSALKYHGTTTTAISDGSTTNPVVISGSNHTAAQGCVVAYGKKEFVWTGSAWEELGNEGNYKVVQTAVSSPSASGSATAFIDTISQDTNGNITVTKKNVSFPSFPSLASYVTGPDSSTADHIAVFKDTTGKVIKNSGYTIAKSVPSNAVFTDSSTTLAGHYTPAEDANSAISASGGSATNITGTSGKLNVVTGLKRDAKGHIVGVTSANIYSTDNNTNYYPTTFTWTNGTTAGPTGSLTGSGMSAVSFGAIPSASASISGVVTTGAQTFAGSKTFTDNITILAENTDKFINFKYTSTDLDSYSWRIGYLGTGQGDNNALTFQTNKTGAWVDALKFTLPGDATFSQSVTATKFITSGGTSSQFVRGNGDCTALTKSEVTTALGYTPPTTNSTYANYSFGNGYATCTTAEATTAKVATYSNYSKQHGGIVAVKFTYAVPANSTLNINSKGAHDIYYNGVKITAGIIGAGDTALFVYDSSTGYVLLSTQVVTKARLGAHKHSYTPAGTIGNTTATGTVGNATAGGSVSSTFTGTAHNHGFTGTAHKHTFTGTAATSGGPSGTTSVYSITGVGSLPSCTLPSTTVSYSNGELSITHNAGSFSAGSLPSRSEVTVASSNHTHSVTATGTIGNTTAEGSLDEVTATGTIGNTTAGGSVSSSFTGTAHNHSFTGTAHNHSFTGTAGTATTIS